MSDSGEQSATGALILSPEHMAALNRRRRVVVNYDAMDVVKGLLPDAGREQLVGAAFDTADAEGSQIDSIWWAWGSGHRVPYPSKILPLIDEPRFMRWAASGFNVAAVFLEETRKRPGLEAFFSYRINGADNYCRDSRGLPLMPPMKEAHPDWLIDPKDVIPEAGDCHCPLWNFAVPGVRDFKVSILREVAEDYDFDGIEIDFARVCPVLPPGHQWENRDALTDLMRSVRTMLLKVEERRGRPFLLAARVPENIEGCHFDGLDVEAWAREQLVDIFVMGIRSYDVDIAAFRRITAGTQIKLYPCIDDGHTTDGYRHPPIEVWRGVFANWWRQGADGICTFNFVNHDPMAQGAAEGVWFPPEAPPLHRQAYREMGSPETLEGKDKTFVVQRRGAGHDPRVVPLPEAWYTPRRMYSNTNMFAQLPARLANDGKTDTLLTAMVADDVNVLANEVESITVHLLLSDPAAEGMSQADRLDPVSPGQYVRGHCWDPVRNIPPAKGIEKDIELRLNNALLGRASVEGPWLVFRAQPRQFALGANLVGVLVTGRPPDARHEMSIEKLEIHLKYR